MKTVILYGDMADKFGKFHKFKAKNVAEVLKALKANHKKFENYMCTAHKYGLGFKVIVGKRGLNDPKESTDPSSDKDIIRIAPAIFGSSGLTKILVGVALIAVGVLLLPAGGFSTGLIAAGAGLIIGGVSQLLTKPPPAIEGQGGGANNKSSFIFSGPANSTIQGGAVPVGYGRMIIGSVIISAGIETYEE